MLSFKCLVIGMTIVLRIVHGLDRDEADSTKNENCSHYLSELPRNISNECPPWHVRSNNGSGCVEGPYLHFLVYFMRETSQPWLETFYCMTTSEENSPIRRDVIGSCLLSIDIDTRSFSNYYPLPCNISELNVYMCAGQNREGQLCGRCVQGFAPPVFSYSLACVNCTHYHLNWLKYIGVAFGPLTVFCLLICFFHISATSPYLFGLVLYCQILSMPTIVRMGQNTNGFKEAKERTRFGERFYVSLVSIWNLDILRAFYEPFCLHPHMSIVQALALDYLVALYPLVLLLIAFTLVYLHGRNQKIIVNLWKPFGLILRPCVRNLNIQTSLIESFATLFILSAMKIQSVSLDLLSPTALYYPDGSTSSKLYLYLAGDIEYFGKHHRPYGFLSLFLLLIFALLPGVLFFCYPCRFFQRLLNKFNCNSVKLKISWMSFKAITKMGPTTQETTVSFQVSFSSHDSS